MSVDEFVTAVSELVGEPGRSAMRPIIEPLRRPIRVRMLGRPGTGVRTLTAALGGAAGLVTVAAGADVHVLVIAECAKPEDLQFLAGADRSAVVALTKADLLGAQAPGRAAVVERAIGRPVIAVSGLWAAAELDDAMVAALHRLADDPVDLVSVDMFRSTPHPVDDATRLRLLAAVDLGGIAVLTAAIRSGGGTDGPALAEVSRRHSGIDGVIAGVHAAAAPLRYRRLCGSMARIRALAISTSDRRLHAFMAGDIAVRATAEAAADVLRADGLDVEPRDAVRWWRYTRGPVGALHRRCGADMTRAALR